MKMLYFLSVRIDPKGLGLDELWELWQKEADATLKAQETGVVENVYKVVGDKRVLGILSVESHDELDRMLMALMPLSSNLIVEELIPIRAYESFAKDLRRKWK